MTSEHSVESVLAETASLTRDAERPDLLYRVGQARERFLRSSAIVVVVGDYKQGKSSFINALLGEDICPTDADFATAAVTLLAYGEEPSVTIHRVSGEDSRSDLVPVEDLGRWVWERANPNNELGVNLAEVRIPNPVLKAGFTIVDTPGLGGFGHAQRRATLHFLRVADAFIYVGDASSELSRIDIGFLAEAHELCHDGFHVLTKTDLYPAWRTVGELNRKHLESVGGGIEVVPVSNVLRSEAHRRGDGRLNEESGFVSAMNLLAAVSQRRLDEGARTAVATVLEVLSLLETEATEAAAVLDGDRSEVEALTEATKQLERLKSGASRWQRVLGDEIGDMRAFADYSIRQIVRGAAQHSDEKIDEIDPAGEWQQFSDDLVAKLTDEIAELFDEIDSRSSDTGRALAELLADIEEAPGLRDLNISPSEMWSTGDFTPDTERPSFFATGFTAMRGVQSGVILLGLVGRFIGLASLLPITLGVGLAFGVKQMLDERKRQLERRRVEAKKMARRFNEKMATELSKVVNDALRQLQKNLRDHTIDRINELQATYASALKAGQEAASASEAERDEKKFEFTTRVSRIEELRAGARAALERGALDGEP